MGDKIWRAASKQGNEGCLQGNIWNSRAGIGRREEGNRVLLVPRMTCLPPHGNLSSFSHHSSNSLSSQHITLRKPQQIACVNCPSVMGSGHTELFFPFSTLPLPMALLFCSDSVKAPQSAKQGPAFGVSRETGAHCGTYPINQAGDGLQCLPHRAGKVTADQWCRSILLLGVANDCVSLTAAASWSSGQSGRVCPVQ